MDKCVGKRAVRGDSRLQYCSRVSSTGGFQNESPEKPERLRASLRFMGDRAIAGSSSKPFSLSGSRRKSFLEQQKQMLLQELDALSSCRQKIDDIESDIELLPVDNVYDRQRIQQVSVSMPKTINNFRSSFSKGISTDITKSSRNSSIASSSKAHKQITRQLVSVKQEASSSSFMLRTTFSSRNAAPGGASRCGLNNHSCTTVFYVFPPAHSCSESVGARSIVMGRKKSSDGESSPSSSRGSSTAIWTSLQNAPIRHPVVLETVLRRYRDRINIRDGAASVRTRTTCRPSAVGRCSSLPPNASILMPQLHRQARVSFPEAVYESSVGALAVDLPLVFNNTSGSTSNDLNIRTRTTFSPEDSHARVSDASLGEPRSYRNTNVERVEEVLLALEQIEQDKELTYEHLLVPESNLLGRSSRLHDQYRDMRMDIDNMSYEELLALEEKMGTVSTALAEDQLSKCLERTTYTIVESGVNSHADDDVKCSVCQEEYVDGNEVGRLQCEHRYHIACIHRWLRKKNWCPICKSCALPPK